MTILFSSYTFLSMRTLEDLQPLMSSLGSAFEKYISVSKSQKDFGIGEPLYPTEIHVLSAISENNGSSVTQIAKLFGTTKGAASQITAKLVAKGYLLKEKDPQKKSRLLLTPTEKGLEAHRIHMEFHMNKDKDFFEYLSGLNEEQFQTFKDFCRQLNLWMDSYLE